MSAGSRKLREAPLKRPTIGKIFAKLRRDGLTNTTYGLALRAVNSVVLLKILKGIVVSRPAPEFLHCPDGFRGLFLSPELLQRYAADPANDLSQSFVEDALAKGDECYAVCDGEALAAYGWYSLHPTRIDPPNLLLRVHRDYVYMYKSFTPARYRGRRLHAFGLTQALAFYLSRDFKGVVSYVESTNFNSLRSCARIGFATFGSIWVSRLFGRPVQLASPGCRRIGFQIRAAPSVRAPSTSSRPFGSAA
jgi:hypothetical protein